MRSLKARVKRLEAKRKAEQKKACIPSQDEYLDAMFRQRTRRLYNAKLKLYRMLGREDELWNRLSEFDKKTIENDTFELRARDEGIEQRWRQVHGPSDEETAACAEDAHRRWRARVEQWKKSVSLEGTRWLAEREAKQ
jgi:hypothetical protein